MSRLDTRLKFDLRQLRAADSGAPGGASLNSATPAALHRLKSALELKATENNQMDVMRLTASVDDLTTRLQRTVQRATTAESRLKQMHTVLLSERSNFASRAKASGEEISAFKAAEADLRGQLDAATRRSASVAHSAYDFKNAIAKSIASEKQLEDANLRVTQMQVDLDAQTKRASDAIAMLESAKEASERGREVTDRLRLELDAATQKLAERTRLAAEADQALDSALKMPLVGGACCESGGTDTATADALSKAAAAASAEAEAKAANEATAARLALAETAEAAARDAELTATTELEAARRDLYSRDELLREARAALETARTGAAETEAVLIDVRAELCAERDRASTLEAALATRGDDHEKKNVHSLLEQTRLDLEWKREAAQQAENERDAALARPAFGPDPVKMYNKYHRLRNSVLEHTKRIVHLEAAGADGSRVQALRDRRDELYGKAVRLKHRYDTIFGAVDSTEVVEGAPMVAELVVQRRAWPLAQGDAPSERPREHRSLAARLASQCVLGASGADEQSCKVDAHRVFSVGDSNPDDVDANDAQAELVSAVVADLTAFLKSVSSACTVETVV